jgi:hypothetical protein
MNATLPHVQLLPRRPRTHHRAPPSAGVSACHVPWPPCVFPSGISLLPNGPHTAHSTLLFSSSYGKTGSNDAPWAIVLVLKKYVKNFTCSEKCVLS